MRKLITTAAVAAAAVGLSATTVAAGPPAERPAPPSAGDTILDIAGGSADFEILAAAATALGLDDELSGNRQLTVFAPTDDAFVDLADVLNGDEPTPTEGDALAIVAGVPGITEIVLFHVSPGQRDVASVVPASELPTLNGATLTKEPGTATLDSAIGTATVQGTVPASNGIVHVIDTVLLPSA
ncbi:MAG TPA: fasciclin domain-containing protein [Acidimicrobiales bacterium]|nr:fasciclin domain-containing protein [Acidimicrobiales bacterium]